MAEKKRVTVVVDEEDYNNWKQASEQLHEKSLSDFIRKTMNTLTASVIAEDGDKAILVVTDVPEGMTIDEFYESWQ